MQWHGIIFVCHPISFFFYLCTLVMSMQFPVVCPIPMDRHDLVPFICNGTGSINVACW